MARGRGRIAALGALGFFAGLAVLPWILPVTGALPWVQAAKDAAPVTLPTGPATPSGPQLSAVATPVEPDGASASAPTLDASHMTALVAAEDQRLRTLLHHSNRITAPAVVAVTGSLPTLVLPARPDPYTLIDLQAAGAVTPLREGGGMALVDSVLVGPAATLKLGGADLSTLLMTSTATGFTSIVTWGGTVTLAGSSAQAPLTITGWDQVNNQPAQNRGYGRPYIRAVGGRLDIRNARVSALGFWSGRTGGVAWTGVNRRAATGSATSSTFTGDTYGAFVSRGDGVAFTDDLFQGNELDGLRLHRSANNAIVTGSASARNGGNGFVVSRGATGAVLRGVLAVHNAGNGFLLNGQPLVNGASPSGGGAAASVGTVLEGAAAENNAHTGIIVEGGQGTVIRNNVVCSPITAIAVRAGAADTSVVGNLVSCGGRVALSIGPAVTGTTVAGNTLLQARIGILVHNAPGVRIMNNRIAGMTVFAISVRGASPGVVGNDNIVSGLGFQAIDVRGGAPSPQLANTDARNWQHLSQLSVLGYLRYHPLLATWVLIILLMAVAWTVARIRGRAPRPYEHTVPWQISDLPTISVTGQAVMSFEPSRAEQTA